MWRRPTLLAPAVRSSQLALHLHVSYPLHLFTPRHLPFITCAFPVPFLPRRFHLGTEPAHPSRRRNCAPV